MSQLRLTFVVRLLLQRQALVWSLITLSKTWTAASQMVC